MDKYLYCYKMTHDTGFAPNPDHGVLTLATCKPTIRRCAKEKYWISGWTAVKMHDRNNKIVHFRDGDRLIYLAQVSKVIKYADYWAEYKEKRPVLMYEGKPYTKKGCGTSLNLSESGLYYDNGDNIYEPDNNETHGFKQHDNGGGHGEDNKQHDISGVNVLICKEFYYFGAENAVELKNIPKIPRCKKILLKDAQYIIDQITKYYTKGKYPQKI